MIYHYRILGTAQARRPDGTEVPLKGARLRALLVALAAGGGRPVAVARLIAQVWGRRRSRLRMLRRRFRLWWGACGGRSAGRR